MVTGRGARWCGTHPGRSHQCVAVNPPHDHPEFKQFRVWFLKSYGIPAGAQAAPTRAAIQSGTGHCDILQGASNLAGRLAPAARHWAKKTAAGDRQTTQVSICTVLPHFLQLCSSSERFNMAEPTEASSYSRQCHHLHSLATFLAAMLFLEAFQHGCTNGALSTPSQQHDAGQKKWRQGTDIARRSHELCKAACMQATYLMNGRTGNMFGTVFCERYSSEAAVCSNSQGRAVLQPPASCGYHPVYSASAPLTWPGRSAAE